MKFNSLTVEATINATADKVWDFWTRPHHITGWLFASDDWHCPHAENDLQAGGSFKSVMASKDGKMSFDFEGKYDEVIDLRKIAYTMADGRKVNIEFETVGNQTKITETFDAETTHPEDFQQSGWQAILDNFKAYAEKE